MSERKEPSPLSSVSVQDIQFELLRRSAGGEFEVEAVIDIFKANPHLWTGAIIDRLGVNERGHRLPPMSMIKLRDIGTNYWNADTLLVLCPGRAAADELAALLPMERFGCMIDIKDDETELDRALGGADDGVVILRAWWD